MCEEQVSVWKYQISTDSVHVVKLVQPGHLFDEMMVLCTRLWLLRYDIEAKTLCGFKTLAISFHNFCRT